MKKLLALLVIGSLFLSFQTATAADSKLVASKNSDKYHLESCATAQKIDAANKIIFSTPEEAVKAGYSPCKICNPPAKSEAFVGNKDSKKYHIPSCKMAEKILTENKISFANKETAEKAGYTPCQICCKASK